MRNTFLVLAVVACTGCWHTSHSGPPPWPHILTCYGGCQAPHYDPTACGGSTACCSHCIDGTWWYSTEQQIFGCGAKLEIRHGNKCVVVQVADNGPASWVESNAAGKCGGNGHIIDTSPLVADYFGGGCGWSQCFWVDVRPVAKSMPQGICPTCPCGGECKPGEVQGQGCGNCGWQERSCGGDAKWGGWGPCNGQGPCAPGQFEVGACGDCGSHSRSCGGNCQWAGWSGCDGPDPGDGKLPCDTGEPGVCESGVQKCIGGWVTCKRLQEPGEEVCDDMDNDCDGPIDEGGTKAMGQALPAFAAQVEDCSFPMVLAPGEVAQGWVEYRNMGAQHWERGQVWLKAEGSEAGSPSAVGVPEEWPAWDVAAKVDSDVAPGELARLRFAVSAPAATGDLGDQHFVLLTPAGQAMRCPEPGFALSLRVAPGEGWWLEPAREEPAPREPSEADPDGTTADRGARGGGCGMAAQGTSLAGLLVLLLPWLAARCGRRAASRDGRFAEAQGHWQKAPGRSATRTVVADCRLKDAPVLAAMLALLTACSSGSGGGKSADAGAETDAAASSLLSIFPTAGTAQGGDEIVVVGTGFAEGMTVRFGDVGAGTVTLLGPKELRVTTPPLIAGWLDVTATWPTGEELTLPAAFEALRLELKFVDVPAYSFPPMPEADTRAGAAGDVDKDSDVDLVLVSAGGPLVVLANDGNGNFEQVFPPVSEPPEPAPEGVVEGADQDVAGYPNQDVPAYPDDVVSPQDAPTGPGDSQASPGDGQGDLPDIVGTDVTTGPPPVLSYDARDVVLVDLDADGCLDAFVSSGPAGSNALLHGDCSGQFKDVTAKHLPEDPGDFGKIAVADVNGDHRPDILLANRSEVPGPQGGNRVYLQNAQAALKFELAPPGTLPSHEESTATLVPIDVDRDGDVDIVVGNLSASDGMYLRLLLAMPEGFVEAPAGMLPTAPGPVSHVAASDVDGDFDPDVIAICAGGQDRLLRNDGTGYFFDDTLAAMPLDKAAGTTGLLADLDRDGFPDLLVANSPHQDRLYLNSGTGKFHDYTPLLPIAQQPTNGVLVLDAEGDHDMDLVLLNGLGVGSRLLLSVRPQGGGGR